MCEVDFNSLWNAQPNGELLLVSCSSKKRKTNNKLLARELYAGILLHLALQFAGKYGFKPLILSAKYGFIEIDDLIEWYDQKLESVYSGDWPDGKGFYVGSSLYFGNTPERFQPLLPKGLPIGKQLAYLKGLIRDYSHSPSGI